MPERCAFTVPGPPIPKARPRTYTDRSGRSQTVTPKRTKAFEEEVGWLAKAAGAKCLEGDVEVRMRFYGTRADGDNLAKAILDGVQGVCFANDAQVVHLDVWVFRKESPARTEVEVLAFDEAGEAG